MFWQNGGPTAETRQSLITAMKLTASASAEPEHFLVAMLEDHESALSKTCMRSKPSLSLKTLRDTIITSSRKHNGQTISEGWSDGLLSERSRAMLADLSGSPVWTSSELQDQQGMLAAAALETAVPRVQRVFGRMGVEVSALVELLRRRRAERPAKLAVFDGAGSVDKQVFGPGGRGILHLIESEGKGLGLTRIGTPLLLFACVARENGLLERALRLQVINPKKAHESLLLHLRALGKNRFNEDFALNQQSMQPAVVRALEKSAELAYEHELPQIGEAELIKALILENDYFVGSFLQSQKVDIAEFTKYLMQRSSSEEDEAAEEESVPSLAEIEQRIRRRVIGQDHVIDTIMPILRRMRFGYTRPHRPLAVLLFLGNSGTGKTQLAKEIAKAMYGSEEQLIFVEMGQFGSEQSKNIFIGAPPGYVGYGEGLLTNGLRDKPESVVLFDEVEKAHRSVFDVLLRFLDEGQIADPAGPVRDGRKCIIILTSNHALDMLQSLIDQQSQAKQLPPAEREKARAFVRRAVLETGFFRPEFLNRVDELILFNTFDAEAYRRILQYQLDDEAQRLRKEKQLDVVFDENLVDALVRRCVERKDEGARVCGKLVGDVLISALIDYFTTPGNDEVRAVRVFFDAQGLLQIVPATGAVAPSRPREP